MARTKNRKPARPNKHRETKSNRAGERRLLRTVVVLMVLAVVISLLVTRTGRLLKYIRDVPAPRHSATEPPTPEKAPSQTDARPVRVAIVIDDLGTDPKALNAILELDAPVSVAVLPQLPRSAETASRALSAGRDVLLHLPMQPRGGSDRGLGPGAIKEGMDGDAIRDTLAKDLSTVPGAVGVNNHMGSAVTEEMVPMEAVMDVLGRRGLFFLDSKTSSSSEAVAAAREKGVRVSARDVFLDNVDDPAAIKGQFERMVELAKRNGDAIAIGHPRPATLSVLKKELPALAARGVKVVGISKLVR